MDNKKSIFKITHDTFIRSYRNLINMLTIRKEEIIKKSDLFANFYNFYFSYWKQINHLIKNVSQTNSEKNIMKKYNEIKKEIDTILDNYKYKNKILPDLKKSNSANKNKIKNLANKLQSEITLENEILPGLKKNNSANKNKLQSEITLENEITNLQKESNNNNFLKKLGTTKIMQLYKYPNENRELKKKVNNILNRRAKKLSTSKALELKQQIIPLSKKENKNLLLTYSP